jgi:hypothetical protein
MTETNASGAQVPCISLLADHLDLMVDEFKRIKALTRDTEIQGLCDRAISNTKQRVPVIVQRNEWERKFWELDKQWSERYAELKKATGRRK